MTEISSSVLIVEDEKLIAYDIRNKLLSFGYTVCGIAGDGPSSIEMAESLNPDVILMDITLDEKMDGIDAAKKIEEIRPVPIIFITAYNDDETLQRISIPYTYGYIDKPFTDQSLKISIKLALLNFYFEAESRKAKEEAEENSKAKSEFLANISHELKTPLNVIVESFDLLNEHRFPAEIEEIIEIASKNANKLKYLIESVLEYTKNESNGGIINRMDFDLKEFLISSWEVHIEDALAKEIVPRIEIEEGIPSVIRTDREKLSMILNNLLDNAVKFTDSGTISLSASFNKNKSVVIHVYDSGNGIENLNKEEVFTEFKQGDGSKTRNANGLGLGLPLSKKIAKRLGVTIDYKIDNGEGTDFYIILPKTMCKGDPYKGFPYPEFERMVDNHKKNISTSMNNTGTIQLKNDYLKIYNEAKIEAEKLGLGQRLEDLIDLVLASQETSIGLEHAIKKKYEDFADNKADICAKLAVAISMDVRNGNGNAVTELFRTFFDTKERQVKENKE